MSGLLGGGPSNTAPSALNGVQIQSSSYGLALPVVYGRARLTGNLVWYGGFQAIPNSSSSGGGKGGSSGNSVTSYTYEANIVIAVCEGQVSDIPTIWRAKSIYTSTSPNTIGTTSEAYAVPSGGGTYTVSQNATYAAPISVSTSSGGGDDGTAPIFYSMGADYVQVGGVYTFPAAMGGTTVLIEYQYVQTGTAANALTQLGLSLKNGAVGQPVWSVLTTSFSAYAVPYSGVCTVVGQNYQLDSTAMLDNHSFEVLAPGAYSIQASIPDADPAVFTKDYLVNTRYGAAFPTHCVGDISVWSNYVRAFGLWMSPVFDQQQAMSDVLDQLTKLTNTAIVWSDGVIKFIPYGDTAQTANGATFTPNVTPVYSLDDSAFIAKPGEEPVQITRKAAEDCYNSVKLNMRNRANAYNQEVVEARDEGFILNYGWRPMPVVDTNYFCDYNAAMMSAQLILQRQLYIRNTFTFKLPWQYVLLEPMDLVTITDQNLGLTNYAVRITEIKEDDTGELTIAAEEFPVGIAHAALYNPNAGLGFSHNYNATPGSVAPPQFFEPPTSLTVTGLEVWMAISGTGNFWGGCQVWVSYDGVNYKMVGTMQAPSRYGTLTGPIAANALPVHLVQGALDSASALDAQNLSTLVWIGGASWEYLAYQNAVLTGTEAYSLTGLNRGAYETNGSASHTAGDPVVRVDQTIGKSGPLDLGLIGQNIYFKFPSFNVYGGGLQSLAAVPQYTYTITGTMAKLPPLPPTNPQAVYEYNGIRIVWGISPSPTVSYYVIRQGASFASGTLIGQVQAQSYLWAVQPQATYQIWVAAVDKFGNFSPPALATTSLVSPSAIVSPTTQVVDNNILFYWSPPAQGSLPILHYQISKGATFGTSVPIGLNGPSTFFTYFETSAGTYTYWISAIDTAGNVGTATPLTVTVSAPPDYVLHADYLSAFPGTCVNALVSQGTLLAPVNATQQFGTRFTANGYTSAAGKIAGGLSLFLEPTLTTGSYEEVYNYGTPLPPTTITTTWTAQVLAGSVTITPTLSYSSDGSTWTSGGAGLSSILAPAFQYVKIHLDFAASGNANLVQITRLETKLSVKQRRDGGSGTANSTDTHAANASTGTTSGTYVAFNYPFISANPPTVTPISAVTATNPITTVVDYLGPANPSGFGVLFYDKNGNRVTTTFTWSAQGY